MRVVIIGGGAAGLATAACLQRRGIRPLVLDKNDRLGQTWAERYDRLHLHTPRVQSHLPGYRLPARAGRWVSRDDMARYLRDYAEHHGIEVRFGVEVRSVRPVRGGYEVLGDDLELTATQVVLATGLSQTPVTPSWPGAESFTGHLLHAADYRNAAAYRGRDVLVVGAGNSGAEIAADLAESGARQVWLAVRTPPHIIPRQLGPLPTTLLGIVQSILPPAWTDPINRRLSSASVGDLSRYGLPAPDEGLSARMRRRGTVPTIDVGLIRQLQLGRVEVVRDVTGFAGAHVHLSDGRILGPDTVIAATGYRTDAAALLNPDAGDDPATPTPPFGSHPPGLYSVGLTQSQRGLLFQINFDARRVARQIARQQP